MTRKFPQPDWRHACLLLLVVGSVAAVWSRPPIVQDLRYHEFADRSAWFGIPNFLNVISNVPFLITGVAGLRFCWKKTGEMTVAWMVFFAGVAWVSFGSGWYHLQPGNAALVWDRLPMTVGFMALTSALLGEQVSERLGRRLLFPALFTGFGSVAYWQWSGDLRFYVWVQFAPLLVIPAMLALFPGRDTHRGMLWRAMGLYALAKMLEAGDAMIFRFTGGIVGGHPLKHLASAFACWMILEMLKRRTGRKPAA
ncbi:MAG TPA: ceramidase domain-containing protein [Luteolibacter sp.]